jgi:hypothetical protein
MEVLYPGMLSRYKRYRSIADPIYDDLGQEVTDEPNLVIPYAYGIVESELPRLAGKLPKMRVSPRKKVDEHDVKRRQNYLYYAFDRMGFLKTQTLWIRQYSIYGWSPLYYYWRKEVSKILSVQDLPDGGKYLQKTEADRYDDFWCKVIDVFDSFLQPGVTSPEDGDWFIFRELVSKQDIKKLIEAGIFYPEVEKFLDTPSGTPLGSGRTDRDALIGLSRDDAPHAYGKYELYWGLEDEKIICTLGSDARVCCMVSDNPNPLQEKPVINCNLTENVSEPIGISTVEALAGLPDKLDALSNARLKDISLKLGKVFLANRVAQCDWDNFVMESGNIIFTDDVNNTVKELEFKATDVGSEREVQTTKEEMQFSVGVSDYIVGVKSGSRLADTATGVSTIVREANARYGLKQAAYEAGALRKLVIACDAYSKVFLTREKDIYVFGPDGMLSSTISPQDIAWDADIIVEPGSVLPLDQAARRDNLLNLADRVLQAPGIVRADRFYAELLESHDFRNVDELIIPQEEQRNDLMSDQKLAMDENVSLSLGQPVPVAGDDQLHIAIHAYIDGAGLSPEAVMLIQNHIQAHIVNIQRLQQQQMAALMAAQGGPNAQLNQETTGQTELPFGAGTGGAPGGPGQNPAMGGVPRMA